MGRWAQLLGGRAAYRAQVGGNGTWTKWDGYAVVRRDGDRFADFQVANRAGLFRLLGQVRPGPLLTGTLASVLGNRVSLGATARIADRTVDGRYRVIGRALALDAKGID